MSLVYRIPSLLGQVVKKVQSKRALRSEILSFQTRSKSPKPENTDVPDCLGVDAMFSALCFS